MNTTYNGHHFAHLALNKRQAASVIAAGLASPLILLVSISINTKLASMDYRSIYDSMPNPASTRLSGENVINVVMVDSGETSVEVADSNEPNLSINVGTSAEIANAPVSSAETPTSLAQAPAPAPPTNSTVPAATNVTPTVQKVASASRINRLVGKSFFKQNPNPAQQQYNEWLNSRPNDAAQIKKIVDQPIGMWIGAWTNSSYVSQKMNEASSKGQTPIWILYNIPNISCNGGGATSANQYRSWIDGISAAIGGKSSVVVIEPDALPLINCLSPAKQTERYDLIRYAVDKFANNANTSTYIDAGHSSWVSVNVMAERLRKVNVHKAQGFSLNVSNFGYTSPNVNYGNQLGAVLDNAHFIVDTSRNGNGPGTNGEWCNPRGRALGPRPWVDGNNNLQDAQLWLKFPGESDGTCNGGPAAGQWWPEYALELAQNASY